FVLCFLTSLFSFFFNSTSPTEFYTLSLHDALPIWMVKSIVGRQPRRLRCRCVFASFPPVDASFCRVRPQWFCARFQFYRDYPSLDRKSTRLNSSHVKISYAVFCLKKKKKKNKDHVV